MAQRNIQRKPLVAGNWKMNTTADEAIELARSIATDIGAIAETDIVLCPPFVWLSSIASVITNTSIKLAAQNLYWEDKGAYTGEISARMLKDVGCDYVIIGHSERRQYFGDTDQTVNNKLKKAIEVELTPIVCLGESLQDREADRTSALITKQFNNGFEGFTDFEKVIIAYEPIWAIGTGKTATTKQAQEVHSLLRGLLRQKTKSYGEVRILYGGSVKPENAAELFAHADIDGFLVGGASLKADDFITIIRAVSGKS
jgi:triosephosphate isomerase